MYNCMKPPGKLLLNTLYLPPTIFMRSQSFVSFFDFPSSALLYNGTIHNLYILYIDHKTKKCSPVVVKGEVLSPRFCASDSSIEDRVLIVNTQSRKWKWVNSIGERLAGRAELRLRPYCVYLREPVAKLTIVKKQHPWIKGVFVTHSFDKPSICFPPYLTAASFNHPWKNRSPSNATHLWASR